MHTKETYIITTETSVIFPYFNECGRLLSMILEGDQIVIVRCSPTEIIDFNLRRGGSSLKGAVEGANEILGSSSLSPVAISKKHGIYMTPTCSSRLPECIWMAIGHVKQYVENEEKQVSVILNNGSRVDLPISFYKFDTRYLRACKLQYGIETNTDQVMKVREKYTQSYILKKNVKGLNYTEE
ncbi:competence protein ComK [Sporosarcina jeotgali]|uniref:Competence protein ComK n=1 Tax=Sporosarcina jeotgali TaxID=3020056 RepID=A0ABZ0KY20_9BACL|nr:competence protein ComK [Sporosarcina sp. B2O-1]WOV84753.1 competence protein ComK [Sporosarcina sp. B2O-1]